MNKSPDVLGLGLEEARRRLEAAGFAQAEVHISGRRREGIPKVIRLRLTGGFPELTVSYFKELNLEM
jgi:hypothetical protein